MPVSFCLEGKGGSPSSTCEGTGAVCSPGRRARRNRAELPPEELGAEVVRVLERQAVDGVAGGLDGVERGERRVVLELDRDEEAVLPARRGGPERAPVAPVTAPVWPSGSPSAAVRQPLCA